jgi:hypothetical protein
MEMTETLKSAIEERNISRIRSVFYTIAHEDPSFASGKYEETLKYVKGLNIEGFIEAHNGSEFAPQDAWDKEYWAEVASELQDNFSQERIDHLIEVGKYVYGKNAEPKVRMDTTSGADDTDRWLKIAGVILGIGLLIRLLKGKK